MITNLAIPLSVDRAQHRGNRVVVDLLMPESTNCAPCQDAVEEIDDAVALVAPELAARGTRLQVRVTPRINAATPGTHGVAPLPELRINGVTIEPQSTQDCEDGGLTACGIYEWDGATYSAPPAELLTAVIHDHLDHSTVAPRSLPTHGSPGRS